ncbi:hypothetical protein QGX12_gp093 [Pseudomonas phage Kremar]|uniref:Uncharacterized protein n=1 Tax=Pseudomonas phage Kremar TaxID=2928831 RepID=A0AAE9GNM1_9CAUD|nr:hypothetical protein QGX12_gp093 [Pseudomonas phage Kremar]UOL48551.1 hypothetical protein [Pseudomonas phage Kremar]
MTFDIEADKYRDLFTIKEFAECVACGAFIPDDGCGWFGTETHYSYDLSVWGVDKIPEGATHVHWYNK